MGFVDVDGTKGLPQVFRRRAYLLASTIAVIPARTASGTVGQAFTIAAEGIDTTHKL